MKRDMELVREILLAVEASDEIPLGWTTIEIDGRSKNELSYHVVLMSEAGLLEAQDLCHMGPDGYDWQPKRLTWMGHEFLDAVRDPEVWRRTKEGAATAGNAGIEFVWELAKAYGKYVVKERLGIDLAN